MKLLYIIFCMMPLTLIAQGQQLIDKEKTRKEIIAMEKAFETEMNAKGAAEAFYNFAADDAVIKRENDTLVKGKNAIRDYYSKPVYKTAKAWWSPDHVDVSEDGTMAYTYGKYKWEMTNADGKTVSYGGIFHTVWKKMPDSSWKYVWD